MRKIKFAHPQTERYNEVEVTFIPTLSTPTEWQGTMIARLYNASNQVIRQEVFNLVMVQEDPQVAHWRPIYEVAIIGGTPLVSHEPDMFGGFALGIPIGEHATRATELPPTNLQDWQRYIGDPPEPHRPEPFPLTERRAAGEAIFMNAGMRVPASKKLTAPQIRQDLERHRARCGPDNCMPTMLAPIRATARASFGPCATLAGGCGIASAFFAGAPFLPCFVRSCSAVLLYQGGRHIFGLQW